MPKSKSLNQQQLQQFASIKVSDIEHVGVQERTANWKDWIVIQQLEATTK